MPILIIAVLLFCALSQAFILDANVFYFSDNFVPAGATTASTTTNYDVRIGFNVDKKDRFYVGWNYSGASTSRTESGNSTQYASTEMGPSFLWVLNKEKTWIISFAYNLVTTATYTPAGGTPEKWKGTSMKGYFGYNFALDENTFFGPTVTYYSASFNEKIINDTTYSTDSNARSQIYPALYFGLRY